MPAAEDKFNLSYTSHIYVCLYALIHRYIEKPLSELTQYVMISDICFICFEY